MQIHVVVCYMYDARISLLWISLVPPEVPYFSDIFTLLYGACTYMYVYPGQCPGLRRCPYFGGLSGKVPLLQKPNIVFSDCMMHD